MLKRSFSSKNPYTRPGFTPKTRIEDSNKLFVKKTPRERKIEWARMRTHIQQRLLYPLKSLLTDWRFLVRVAGFSAIVGLYLNLVQTRSEQGIPLFVTIEETEEQRKESSNKFSKTFGHEKKLDEILKTLKTEEPPKQLSMDDILAEK